MQHSNVPNPNNSQSDGLAPESSLTNKNYDLVFVGSGISCAYTLIHYISRLKEKLQADNLSQSSEQPIKVAVLDKSGEFWSGIPYGSRSGRQSLIITALKEFLPQPERDRFISWLTENYTSVFLTLQQRPGVLTDQWLESYKEAMLEGNWDDLFIPRYVFGLYVKDQVEQLLQEGRNQGYLECDLFSGDVFNIQKVQESYQVEFATPNQDNSLLIAQKVILAIGSPPNRIPFLDQFEVAEKSDSAEGELCFIPNMYEPSQNNNIERVIEFLKKSNVSGQNQVVIVGSNASALETLYSLNNVPEVADLISKFIVISPAGAFPHRIYNNPPSTTYTPQNLTDLAQLEHLTAEQILEAVKKDVKSALEQNETVDATYSIISKGVINALNKLNFDEQKLFVTKYGVEIGKYQRRAGGDYLNVVDKLILEGRLEFIQGKFVQTIPLTQGESGFEFVTSAEGNQESRAEIYTSPIKVVINCAGFQDLTRSSSPLIKNLVQQGICIPNDSKCGFEMNENFEANENLYLMGPLVAGNINDKLKVWHAESCGRIFNLSQKLAEVLV